MSYYGQGDYYHAGDVDSLYQEGDFWSDVGGAISSVVNFAAPIVSTFLPGVGPLVGAGMKFLGSAIGPHAAPPTGTFFSNQKAWFAQQAAKNPPAAPPEAQPFTSQPSANHVGGGFMSIAAADAQSNAAYETPGAYDEEAMYDEEEDF